MKLLKIDTEQGLFLTKDGDYRSIDLLTKEDLKRFIGAVLNDDADFDEYDENAIKNRAHQVVYKSIFRNLQTLKDRRQEFKDESERLFLIDFKRYTEDATQQQIKGIHKDN